VVGVKGYANQAAYSASKHAVMGMTKALAREVQADGIRVHAICPGGVDTEMATLARPDLDRAILIQPDEVADVVLFLVEAGRWGSGERDIVGLLPKDRPVILVVNKIDRLAERKLLLPFLERVSAEHPFAEIVPVSAERGENLAELLRTAGEYLPEALPVFDTDDITDRPERFLAGELLREKLFRNLGEELPYGMTVEIERFEQDGELRRIHAAVIVDKVAHKAIVIGKAGERLKRISTDARKDMERLFGGRVWLETWVKVKSGWADDERALKSLGYE
jgi:GTP-binding protein Era